MSSGPNQAQKVFAYAFLFKLIIISFVTLVGLFVFVCAPNLPKTEIWPYIIAHIPPIFRGFLAISLLAMAMSTADSCLNACSVMVSHDIVGTIQNEEEIADDSQLKIAKRTTIVVGLFAMLLAFKCKDLFKLLRWALACSIPMTAAPFILAIYGFRGTSRTALIGMSTGILTIIAWNKWVDPATGMDGSFICMLANGLAMMASHYLFKQPKSAGWVGPDDTLKQIQQENARKKVERKEKIKNSWTNKKNALAKLIPRHSTMVHVGVYTTITGLLAYFTVCITNHSLYLILQLFISACCIGYPFLYDISKKIRDIPKWFVGLCWLALLAVYLPKNLIWH